MTRPWSIAVRCCPLKAAVVDNAVLRLLRSADYLLMRQIERLANEFKQGDGFTERLYRVRSAGRDASAGRE